MPLPTVRPMTTTERAQMQLGQIRAFADTLEGDELFNFRMALSEMRDLLKDYGTMGALALQQVQLEMSLGESQAEPTAH